MKIADIESQEEIKAAHEESGFDYVCPEFMGDPRFPIQRVVTLDGKLLAASLVKVEAEVYLIPTKNGTPQERWEAIRALHADVVTRARAIGFDSLYCVLPPEIERSFGPRIQELGWVKDRGWSKYTFQLL